MDDIKHRRPLMEAKENFYVACSLRILFFKWTLSLSLEALYQNTYAVDRLSLFGRWTDRGRYSGQILTL